MVNNHNLFLTHQTGNPIVRNVYTALLLAVLCLNLILLLIFVLNVYPSVFFLLYKKIIYFWFDCSLLIFCYYLYLLTNTWNDSNKYHFIWYTLCILTFIPEGNLYYINMTNTNTFNLIHYLPIDISDFILKSKFLYVL